MNVFSQESLLLRNTCIANQKSTNKVYQLENQISKLKLIIQKAKSLLDVNNLDECRKTLDLNPKSYAEAVSTSSDNSMYDSDIEQEMGGLSLQPITSRNLDEFLTHSSTNFIKRKRDEKESPKILLNKKKKSPLPKSLSKTNPGRKIITRSTTTSQK